jgi:hypothetical protein
VQAAERCGANSTSRNSRWLEALNLADSDGQFFRTSDPDPGSDFLCSMENDVLEQDTCSIYPGLTFSEQPGKILQIEWNGFVRSGVPPVNAFAFGFTEDGDIACSLEASGFQAAVPRTVRSNPGECAGADLWVYDANGG